MLPSFYSHYAPKVTSAISLVDPRNNAKGTNISSAFSFRNKVSGSHNPETGGNRLVHAGYLELGAVSRDGSSEQRTGPITTIEGGAGIPPWETDSTLNRDGVGNGITKTVFLESHRQQGESSRFT